MLNEEIAKPKTTTAFNRVGGFLNVHMPLKYHLSTILAIQWFDI